MRDRDGEHIYLELVAGVGGRDDDGVVEHCEAVCLVGVAEDPETAVADLGLLTDARMQPPSVTSS